MAVRATEEKSVHQEASDQYITYYAVGFTAGGTQSQVANLDGKAPVRIIVPATYSKTNGGTLRVQVSQDDSTYYPLWSGGTAYTVAVAPSQAVAVDATKFWGVKYIRLHSTLPRGTASTQHAALCTIVARLM